MTNVTIEAGTLLANVADRTVTGLLVPYGEVGNTNLGKFRIPGPGRVKLPRDPAIVGGNIDHDREQPVARATALTEHAGGVDVVFAIGNTEEGDALLASVASGERTKLSSEIKNVVIRAGELVSGALFGGAFVAKGAFPSSSLYAADIGDLTADVTPPAALVPGDDKKINIVTTTTPDEVVVHPQDGDAVTFTPAAPETETEAPVGNLAAPSTLNAKATTGPRPLSIYEVGVLFAQHRTGIISEQDFQTALAGQDGKTLFAALPDVKFDGTGGLQPTLSPNAQWLAQVWQASNYRQQILPLFDHKDLTALNFTGWKWGTKPAGGDWAGNKANVPGNTLTVAAVPGQAERYAIGHDIAREFVDFPIEGFFESYAEAVTEDYKRWADGKVAGKIVAGATTITGDALSTLPGSTGGTIGSAASAIIDGASVLVTAGVLPDFALLAPALWKQMAKMPKANVLGYLNAALGLEEGDLAGFTIRPSASVATGKVLVGAKAAATVLELPGAPIRIDALDLARGGVDKAAFGYVGVSINDAAGLQLVTAATA